MTPAEMIEVIKAYENDQEIQMSIKNKNDWKTGMIILWNFGEFDYRVKPKEKIVYQYMYIDTTTNKYYATSQFYESAFEAQLDKPKTFQIVQRLHYTKQAIKE